MTGNTPHNDEPMHPLTGLVVSIVKPRSVCEQAWRETGVWMSFLYHVLGLLIFFFGMVILDIIFWDADLTSDLTYMDPGELPIVLLFIAVWLMVIQLCYLFTAWLTSCWGSGLERFGEGVGRSLSRWYQLTPFHAVWTLVFIVAMNILDEIRWHHWDYYDYSSFGYQVREFIYSGLFLLAFILYCGGVGYFTLRALAVPRCAAIYRPKCRWPALCETCGYAIFGLTSEQTCPECGRQVETSHHTPRGNQQGSILAKMRMALFNPTALGQTMLTRTRTLGQAKALAITALALLLTGPIGVLYIFIVTQVISDGYWFDGAFEFLQMVLIGGLGAGLGAACIGTLIVLSVGSLVSTIDRVFGKRHTSPAACQAACYASGYVVFMALLMFGFTGVMIVVAEEYFHQMSIYWVLYMLPLIWIGVCLLLTLPYCAIVGRIVHHTRYANT